MAGLVAAHELSKLGHEVKIIEARTRPGGRVHTLREPFSDGLYAEAGVARIPDNHELTLKYVVSILSANFSWIQGALSSGLRAVKKISESASV